MPAPPPTPKAWCAPVIELPAKNALSPPLGVFAVVPRPEPPPAKPSPPAPA
ncbi:MAG: hypothetical protein IPN01_12195 [Deltaproteobacteria bacterium]|nr:hypothetical protein [Deltaproteobacteria bacterium]